MVPIRVKQIILGLIIFYSLGCDVEEKLAEGIDAAFIEVSGKVTHNGNAVGSALILLVEGTEIADGLELSNGSISGQNGNYNIYEVSEGEYYVVAIEDNNNNLTFDADTDRLGFHGVDPSAFDLLPDIITVNDEDVDNINIIYLVSL